jgi:hypothetical protein
MNPLYYHRLQSVEQNELMAGTGRVAGRAPRNYFASSIPKVKAFIGPLPEDGIGIEFTTAVEPDRGCPPGYAYWSEGSPGVETMIPNELVAIPVTITARRDHL